MTENECVELLSEMKKAIECNPQKSNNILWSKRHFRRLRNNEKHISVYDMAIKSLEEIQKYQAIGTVEEFRKVARFLSLDNDSGIIEDLQLLNKYQFIGTVEEFWEARERQRAKKPLIKSKKKTKIRIGDYVYVNCPCCGEDIFSCFYYLPWNDSQKSHEHCKNCGQKLDWSE